jgi:hypothetical protein
VRTSISTKFTEGVDRGRKVRAPVRRLIARAIERVEGCEGSDRCLVARIDSISCTFTGDREASAAHLVIGVWKTCVGGEVSALLLELDASFRSCSSSEAQRLSEEVLRCVADALQVRRV